MQDSENFSDDVPVADAVEQHRAVNEAAVDEESSAEPPDEPPLEVAGADWADQLETVDFDPDERTPDE